LRPDDGQTEPANPPRHNVHERGEGGGGQQGHRGRCCCSRFEEAGEGEDGMFGDGRKHGQHSIIGFLLLLDRRDGLHDCTYFLVDGARLK
jgi:hypothetical protein